MSFLSSLFGGGNNTHTTTTTSSYPSYVQDAQRRITEGAVAGMEPFLSNPGTYVAPMNQFQDYTGYVADEALHRMFPTNYGDRALDLLGSVSPGADRSGSLDGYVGSMNQHAGENLAPAAMSTVGAWDAAMPAASAVTQIGYDDIAALSNPYRDDMINVQVGRIDDDHKKRSADIAGRAARRGSFGGSGEAIAQFLNDQNTGERIDDAVRSIAYDSYGQGANLAQTNAGLKSQAQDRFIDTVFGGINSDRAAYSQADGLQGNYFNRLMSGNQFDVNTILNADALTNSAFNRDRANYTDTLTGLTTAEGLNSGWLDRIANASSLLGSYGDKVQTQNQQEGDRDYITYSRLAGTVPGYQPTTTSTQPVYNNPMGNLMGLGMMASSWF